MHKNRSGSNYSGLYFFQPFITTQIYNRRKTSGLYFFQSTVSFFVCPITVDTIAAPARAPTQFAGLPPRSCSFGRRQHGSHCQLQPTTHNAIEPSIMPETNGPSLRTSFFALFSSEMIENGNGVNKTNNKCINIIKQASAPNY